MTPATSLLSLPYIQANQAQKHITHNEALRILDAVTQLTVLDSTFTAPPATPASGDRYIVADAAGGDWAGQDGKIALFDTNGWLFLTPAAGWQAWDQGSATQLVCDGVTWTPVTAPLQNVDFVGVRTTADDTNRLAVASHATLLTHAGGGHQVKVNKNAAGDTASLLFQTNWSGRAEMGTAGSDNFEIKVSPDGSAFHQALVVDGTTGAVTLPNTTLSGTDFGTGDLITTDYAAARAGDLVANGTGALGNGYNMPASFTFDAGDTPNLPGAFRYDGYDSGLQQGTEFIPVDPNQAYRLLGYLKQDAVPGDWSAFAHGDRHQQSVGVICYDIDRLPIQAAHHMRYRAGGTDSLTTLTQPLSPGDTVIHVASVQGWNTTDATADHCGVAIFGYENSHGGVCDGYTRLVDTGLFAPAGVDAGTQTITLTQPLPASLANPNDPGGTWPVGTSLANATTGADHKPALLDATPLPASGAWYQATGHLGGIDRSGSNEVGNFAPGTAFVKLAFLPNQSNQSGGAAGYPDTGATHGVGFAGLSMAPAPQAQMVDQPDGSVTVMTLQSDPNSGTVTLANAGPTLTAL